MLAVSSLPAKPFFLFFFSSGICVQTKYPQNACKVLVKRVATINNPRRHSISIPLPALYGAPLKMVLRCAGRLPSLPHLCWLCMVIRRPASPSPLHVALARGVCASGLCGSRTGLRGPPSPAAAEQWFSTFWGLPSGSPPPSLPLLSSLGHLGVQQQL